MDSNTTQLLTQLANKLGTTTEYLWEVLIKQAPISATVNLFQILGLIVFGLLLYKSHKKFGGNIPNHTDYTYYEKSEGLSIMMFTLAIILMILYIVAFFTIDNVISGYLNPEYWALHNILQHM